MENHQTKKQINKGRDQESGKETRKRTNQESKKRRGEERKEFLQNLMNSHQFRHFFRVKLTCKHHLVLN